MSQPTPTIPISPYLTTKQVADLMQVKESTVRLWLRRGLLKGFRAGHCWRVSQEALEAFAVPAGLGDEDGQN